MHSILPLRQVYVTAAPLLTSCLGKILAGVVSHCLPRSTERISSDKVVFVESVFYSNCASHSLMTSFVPC